MRTPAVQPLLLTGRHQHTTGPANALSLCWPAVSLALPLEVHSLWYGEDSMNCGYSVD